MRIIAGQHRGTKLTAPTGEQTRPTLDRVRENLFNILDNPPYIRKLIGGHVMDIFAGSGAMGLEAYSRGASHITYVENHNNALSALRANISKCHGTKDNHTILTHSANQLPTAHKQADIIIMDAPYHQNLHQETLECLHATGWTQSGTIIVLQQSPDEPIPNVHWATVIKDKTYGKSTRFIFMEVS